jgi:hypothetical protein
LRLGHAHALNGVPTCDSSLECARVCVSNIFTCEDHKAPTDKSWIFTADKHACKPVHRSVWITAAHRLDERACEVVVLVAVAVKDWNLAIERCTRKREIDAWLRRSAHRCRSCLQCRQRASDVAVACTREVRTGIVIQQKPGNSNAIGVYECATKHCFHVMFFDRL